MPANLLLAAEVAIGRFGRGGVSRLLVVRRLNRKKLLVGVEDVRLEERLMLILAATTVIVISVVTIGS